MNPEDEQRKRAEEREQEMEREVEEMLAYDREKAAELRQSLDASPWLQLRNALEAEVGVKGHIDIIKRMKKDRELSDRYSQYMKGELPLADFLSWYRNRQEK